MRWTGWSEVLVGKPVGVLNLFERATHAHASLIETLHTMAALVVPDASVALPMGLTQALNWRRGKDLRTLCVR
jgi:hypothetical protein